MRSPDAIRRLTKAFSRLPGIGEKTALRLSYFLISSSSSIADELQDALGVVKNEIRMCSCCGVFTDQDLCRICDDQQREKSMICVVDSVQTMAAIESTEKFNGTYHVLHGVLSPLDGIGPEELRIDTLVRRLQIEVKELIVAVAHTLEGEATMVYLQRLCAPMGIRVTRLASGIPMGAELEYTDPMTLVRAFDNRTVIGE